ncbi:hypothetical protein SACS_1705 [Parasaccharibacter apium]|uniref:Uncharacterized protein n=1 Tax=Parasaccharibacter apium TaxID=1510841 RepID=A0A7U7G7B6_9PROT|nr:hypothetical protein SACS_1705 [Parasaccharibacter apium]
MIMADTLLIHGAVLGERSPRGGWKFRFSGSVIPADRITLS